MRLLLDTHVWLWNNTGDIRISHPVRDAISDRRNDVYVSAASVWEIAMKYRLAKLPLPLPPHEYAPAMLARAGFDSLPITAGHAAAVAALPDLHRDPFDRLLIAQALHEELTIITVDPIIAKYAVATIDARG
jgi:PIN domain nuclease of toxin-antitoxin system